MIHLLDNYTFSPALRYEGHRLIYTYSEKEEPIQIEGFLGAALLCVRLINSEEGERREIPLDIERKQDFLFSRYEQEVIADGWGYLEAELRQLNDAYIQFTVSQVPIVDVCANVRQFSIAMSLLSAYMQRLVTEEFGEHIYELVPWQMPFAQWLFNAAYAEPRRQRFLQMDWTEPALVHDLACYMDRDTPDEPLVYFESEEAADILARYWDWLWNFAQKDAAIFPDANVRMAEYKERILRHETDWDFIKPEMKDFPQEQINLFRQWMNQWTAFIEERLKPETPKMQRKKEDQLFFPDTILQCPTDDMEEKYAAAREYITERKKYDKEFRIFVKNSSHAKLCRQLTMLFGWYVDPNSLRKSMLRKPKRKTKKYT